jgi:hypothetical protein
MKAKASRVALAVVAAVVVVLSAYGLIILGTAPIQGDSIISLARTVRSPAWAFVSLLSILGVAGIVVLIRVLPNFRAKRS